MEDITTHLKKLEEEIRNHPVRTFFRRWRVKLINLLPDIKLNIKTFIQRGKRGYGDSDLWDFFDYLSDVISNGIKDLKEIQSILPTIETLNLKETSWKDNEPEEVAQKRWDSILNKIIKTFKIAKKISREGFLYHERKDIRERMRKVSKARVISKKEWKEYQEGWKLLQKHFFSLWD